MTSYDESAERHRSSGPESRGEECLREDDRTADYPGEAGAAITDFVSAGLGSEALAQMVTSIALHTAGSAAIIGPDLQVISSAGDLFCWEQAGTGTPDLQRVSRQLGDEALETELRLVFDRQSQRSGDFIARQGHRLRRTISLLQASAPVALLTYRDVSPEYIERYLAECQRMVTDALARHETPQAIFQSLAVLLESYSPAGTCASVLWLEADGRHLRHIAGPSLPKAYTDAIDGTVIGPAVGSCGTAAYTGKPVVVENIETDPLWNDFRKTALAFGLRACWSQPILAPGGAVLGTLAMYRDTPAAPSATDLTLLDMSAQLASMTIRDLRSEDEIRFQAALLDGVDEAVIATDLDGVIRYWGRGAVTLLGYPGEDMLGASLQTCIDMAQGMAAAREHGSWSGELDLNDKDGHHLTAVISLSVVTEYYGERCGFVAILRNITERILAEERVAEQNRQHRMVAYLGRVALGDIELQALLDFAVESLAEVLAVPMCKVLELEPEGNALLLRSGVGWHEGLVGTARVGTDNTSQAGFTLLSAIPVVVEDLQTETRFSGSPMLHEHGVVSGMSVIIHGSGDRPYGVLGIHSPKLRRFGDHDINFLQSVANVLAESIRRKHANEILRHSEQRFRDLADAMPQIVWSANEMGQADYFNDRWHKLVGPWVAAEDADPWQAMLHPDDREKWFDKWQTCVRDRTPFEMECRIYIAQEGGYRWQLVRASPVLTAQGSELRWYGSSTDIDEQKGIEHRLRDQTHQLEMVNWINGTLAAELDLEKLVQTVIDVGTQLSGAKFGAYFHSISASSDPCFELYALSGVSLEAFSHLEMPRMTELFRPAFDGNVVLRSDDILTDPRYGRNPPYPGHPGRAPSRPQLLGSARNFALR